jgi:hypothetical protein
MRVDNVEMECLYSAFDHTSLGRFDGRPSFEHGHAGNKQASALLVKCSYRREVLARNRGSEHRRQYLDLRAETHGFAFWHWHCRLRDQHVVCCET